MTNRNLPVDLVFVLDATKSTQPIFSSMVDHVNDLAIDLKFNFRKANFNYGAVIYRDPVDYKEIPEEPLDPYYKKLLDQIKAETKKKKDQKLRDHGIDVDEFNRQIEEKESHYDRRLFPFNKNVAIDLKKDIEQLIIELMKVECGAGNDDPEDWVGALTLALNSISWRPKSKRAIIWIADSNAHGKPFCGYDDNHNVEAPKMDPLVQKMAKEGIHFIGINVIRKSDRGCERTLQRLKDLNEKYGGRSFTIEEFEVPKVDFLDEDDVVWPEDIMNGLIATINKSLKKMANVFDDTAI